METILSLIPSLSIKEQDALMIHILQNRTPTKPTKKTKKNKAANESSPSTASESLSAPVSVKKIQTDNQKAWTNFIKQVRDTIRENTWECNFTYKNAMNIASILKKRGFTALDNEIILENYHTWRKENPPSAPTSDIESVRSANKNKKE